MLWLERVKHALFPGAVRSNGSGRFQAAALEQHLADAARALEVNRAHLRDVSTQIEQLTTERYSAEVFCSNLERDVDVALEEEREDLARYTLVRLLERQRVLERVSSSLARVEEEHQNLQALVQEQQAALADVEARARALMEGRGAERIGKPEPIDDEQVELDLLKRKRQRAAQRAPTTEETDD